MSEQQAAYMAEALADGRHMTEGTLGELLNDALWSALTAEQEAAMVLPARVRSSVFAIISLVDGAFGNDVAAEVRDYIETLEQALSASWWCYGHGSCGVCGISMESDDATPHAADCIIPALIEKYPDA